MAISGSLTYKNKSKNTLKVTGITWLDDDAERGGIQFGDKLAPNGLATASMSNGSLIPRGIGIDITFTSVTDPGINISIHLEIPAVGEHSLNTLGANKLKAGYSGGTKNQYVADITDA